MIKFYMLKIISLIIPCFLLASNSLVEALKKNPYHPTDGVIITTPKTFQKEEIKNIKVNDLDFILLQKKIKEPLHPLNQGVMELKKTQKIMEKDLSSSIKKLFFIPKEIKVKSAINRDKIETNFIYIFKD